MARGGNRRPPTAGSFVCPRAPCPPSRLGARLSFLFFCLLSRGHIVYPLEGRGHFPRPMTCRALGCDPLGLPSDPAYKVLLNMYRLANPR